MAFSRRIPTAQAAWAPRWATFESDCYEEIEELADTLSQRDMAVLAKIASRTAMIEARQGEEAAAKVLTNLLDMVTAGRRRTT